MLLLDARETTLVSDETWDKTGRDILFSKAEREYQTPVVSKYQLPDSPKKSSGR